MFAPFAKSMNLQADAYLPQADIRVSDTGFSWWEVDKHKRAAQLLKGARDLAQSDPPERAAARIKLAACISSVRRSAPQPRPLFLGGFSQGGMLACDAVVHRDAIVDGLILLSSCRVAVDEWHNAKVDLSGLPVLIAHGTEDSNISLAAGRALAASLRALGCLVEWLEFAGGHETPLPVWRAVRRFVRSRAGIQHL